MTITDVASYTAIDLILDPNTVVYIHVMAAILMVIIALVIMDK